MENLKGVGNNIIWETLQLGLAGVNNRNNEQRWGWWFLLPIYPYQKRPTIRQEIVKNRIWSFEQPHGLLYAIVPIRMTVIRLEKGGLLVYCPVAPTKECVTLVRELESVYGQVKYIIHSTSSGLEHKVFVGPFARHFPEAQVWCVPKQWSFPLSLPLSWLGFPPSRTYFLPADWRESPLAEEFQYAILQIPLPRGFFVELALLHKPSQTLLLTDTVIKIPHHPPAILQVNPFPLLFHARENAFQPPQDTPENRIKGWQRICLFALYFRPAMVETLPWAQVFQNALKAPNRSRENYFGLYPFHWLPQWRQSFEAIANWETPLVPPIVRYLILPQDPVAVKRWVSEISNWDFRQIIPAHFAAPISANGYQFRKAFSFLETSSHYPSGNEQILLRDSAFIQQLRAILLSPPPVLP